MQKEKQPREYDEVNIIEYIRTLKNHLGLIIFITVVVTMAATLISILGVEKVAYTNEAVVSLGNIQGKPIEKPEDVIDFLSLTHKEVVAEKGKSDTVVVLTSKGPSQQETQKNLGIALDAVRTRENLLLKKNAVTFDEQIELVKTLIKESGERVIRSQRMIDRLSPFDQAQALTLQGYLGSNNIALSTNDALKRQLQELELKKSDYKETEILISPPASSKVSRQTNMFLKPLIGLILGLFLGIFSAFIKEWWDENKSFLR